MHSPHVARVGILSPIGQTTLLEFPAITIVTTSARDKELIKSRRKMFGM